MEGQYLLPWLLYVHREEESFTPCPKKEQWKITGSYLLHAPNNATPPQHPHMPFLVKGVAYI